MRAKAHLLSADTTALEIAFTASIGDWRRLRSQLAAVSTGYPGWRFAEAIDAVIAKLTAQVDAEVEWEEQ